MSLDKIKEVIFSLQQQVRGLPVHRYGTITALEPLTLVLDGERGTILEPYKNCSVKVGDRVSCLRQGTQTIILAVVGGGPRGVDGWLEECLGDGQYRWTRHWRDRTPLPITTAWVTTAFYTEKACPALPAGAILGRLEAVSLSGSYWCSCTDSMLQVQFARPNSATVAFGVSVSLTAYGTRV